MREYGQYCPVAVASEVVADRWTPLILREMVLGNTRFNDIERCLPGISRSLLLQRLKHLERKGIVERRPTASGRGHEYHLTAAGRDLEPILIGLGEWAVRWMFREPQPREVDPVTLTWWLHRRVDFASLPSQRVVMQFDFRPGPELKGGTYWMVLDRGEASVCLTHPGFEADVLVSTDALALMRVFSGLDRWGDAVDDGRIRVAGAPNLLRRLPTWFAWSPFAPAVQARMASAAS